MFPVKGGCEGISPRISRLILGRTRNDRHSAAQGVFEADDDDWAAFPKLRQLRVSGDVAPIKLTDRGNHKQAWLDARRRKLLISHDQLIVTSRGRRPRRASFRWSI